MLLQLTLRAALMNENSFSDAFYISIFFKLVISALVDGASAAPCAPAQAVRGGHHVRAVGCNAAAAVI